MKPLSDHEVAGVGQHRLVQTGDVAQQIVEAVARHTTGGIQVDAVKALHDIHMVGDGVIGHDWLAEALHFTLWVSSGPMGTLGSIIWGIVYMISWILA